MKQRIEVSGLTFYIRISLQVSTILFLGCISWACSSRGDVNPGDWPEYLGGPERNHYSALTQITIDNVARLVPAWEYHTGDSGQIQCNPIIINGKLYGMTATTEPFALDAATGREIWRVRDTAAGTWYSTSRGVAYWSDGRDERILYTREDFLFAVDANNGTPIRSFGENGKTSLRSGLGETAKGKFVISNTPGTIYKDLIIMPLRISEGVDAAPGYVQAFNIKTGAVAWVFKTIPHPGEEGYDTWPTEVYKNTDVGAANNWAGMAVDRERGIVYVPTGSAAFDFYGGNRKGENLFANTLLALDANTGRKIWHYQMVHHDILDRDPPAAPNLLTVTRNGKKVDAVAQITKQGYVFLFDRENGKPLFDIEEIPAPASDIPGEAAWPTQPRPVKPRPYARQELTEADINPLAPNKDELVAMLKQSRAEGPFTPLSRQGTIIFPGLDGGGEWGGAAVDPEGILYVNSNEMAWHLKLEQNEAHALQNLSAGAAFYNSRCAVCHGAELKGNPASGFPSIVDYVKKNSAENAAKIIKSGKGMMPAFNTITENELQALLAFMYSTETPTQKKAVVSDKKEPGQDQPVAAWKISGYTKFLDKDGFPAITPPWGTLHAIDMNTGDYVWSTVYGETDAPRPEGMRQTGSESYGGPVITKTGLLLIAGTRDQKFRAYNKATGTLLWETKLPAAAFATPSTYEVNGRQYVVIACGGTKLGAAKGESYVAFALPAPK